MQSAEIHSRLLLTKLQDHPALPVERLQWEAATRPMDEDVLRVALSHGAACRQGLLVDLEDLIDLEGGDEIRRNSAEYQSHQATVAANDDIMEELVPGWRESVPDLNRELDESMDKSAHERDHRREDLLAMPPIPELAAHWQSLGGRVPSAPA